MYFPESESFWHWTESWFYRWRYLFREWKPPWLFTQATTKELSVKINWFQLRSWLLNHFKVTTYLPAVKCYVMRSLDSSWFHRPMVVDDSRKHPNPLGKLQRKERNCAPEGVVSPTSKLNYWSTTEDDPWTKDIQRLKISAVFPDTIGMTSWAETPMV